MGHKEGMPKVINTNKGGREGRKGKAAGQRGGGAINVRGKVVVGHNGVPTK